MRVYTQKIALWVLAVVIGSFLSVGSPVFAANYTWTNTSADASGFWTNGILWGNPSSATFPGGGDSAFLTNQFSGAATNILNSSTAGPLGTVSIGNGSGEMWLIVTNGASSATILNTTSLTFGNGGRLEIDSGGVVTGIHFFTWSGSNGAIWLNNGGQLFTSNTVTIGGSNGANITGLVASASAAGGVWNLSGQSLTINSNYNMLALNNVTVTNAFSTTVGGATGSTSNNLAIGSGSRFFSGQIVLGSLGGGGNTLTASNAFVQSSGLIVGNGSSNNTVNVLANSIWNNGAQAITVGSNTSVGNLLNISGGVVSNVSAFNLGSGSFSSGNRLVISNGGWLVSGPTVIGGQTSRSNSVLVTGAGSVWSNTSTFIYGSQTDLSGIGGGNLTIANGGLVYVASGYGSGNMLRTSTTVTDTGSVLRVASNGISVGGANDIFDSLIVSNGGLVVLTSGSMFIGQNSSHDNSVIVTGPGSVISNFTSGGFALQIGVGAASANSLLISNGGMVVDSAGSFESSGTNSSVIVTGAGSVWTNAGQLSVGNTGVSNSILIANGGRVFFTANTPNSFLGGAGSNHSVTATDPGSLLQISLPAALPIGNSGNSSFNQLTISNGANFIMSDLTVGAAQGSKGNAYNLIGLVNAVTASNGLINVGSLGSGFNQMIVTNANLMSGAVIVGYGSSNNAVTVLANSRWNMLNSALTIGQSSATTGSGGNTISTGNVLMVNGGILSNVSTIVLGFGGGQTVSDGNKLLVANGGQLIFNSTLTVGGLGPTAAFGGNNNAVVVTGAGSILSNSAGLTVGSSAGGTNNSLTIANGGAVVTAGGITGIGSPSAVGTVGGRDWVLVTDPGSVWSNTPSGFFLGTTGAGQTIFGNSLTVSNGGSVFLLGGTSSITINNSSSNAVIVTGSGSALNFNGGLSINSGNGNTISLSNSGRVSASGVVQLASTGNGNTFTVTGTNSVWQFVGNPTFGNALVAGGTSNQFTISNGGMVVITNSFATANTRIGSTVGGNNNSMLITGGGSVLTNFTGVLTLVVGDAGAFANSLSITAGGALYSGALTVGNGLNANSNNFTVADSTSSNGLITIGTSGGGFNRMTANNASLWSSGLIVGGGSSNNAVTLSGSTLWNNLGNSITVGSAAATGNVLMVSAGASIATRQVTVGTAAGSSGNSVFVGAGGVLEANSLSNFFGGTGNTISNVGGVYQFTMASPTNAPNGSGGIALIAGTISFRAINNADVTNNLGRGALSGITFAGADTFMLNAASNTTAGQTYTFQSVAGNPSNYVNLAMVNASTAYRGGDLTIGGTGSMLVSNTAATITGLFTNQGLTRIVSATAAFSNGLVNAGILALQNGTITGNLTNQAFGTLKGNGIIQGNVMSFGMNSPGFSVGTLSITGNLTFASTAVTWMELSGYGAGVGTNDLFVVGGTLNFGGQLTVTNLNGFSFAAGQSFQLFQFTSHTGDFGVTNLPDLSAFGLSWDTTQLSNQGILSIVVVPEPSTLMLLVGAITTLVVFRRRRSIP